MPKISGLANPRQVILVTSRAETEKKFSPEKAIKDDIFAVAWHMPVSFEPLMYAISAGKERYSTKLIRESGIFVVNFMPFELEKEVLFCGRNSGEHMDKFEKTSLEKEDSDKVDCSRIKQAAGFLECHVEQEIDAGDHIIFIGKVLNSRLNKETKRLFQIKDDNFTTTR